MGDPTYKVTAGTITFDGQDITALSADKRSLAGIFLSYQAPVEVPGVPLYSFLRTVSQMRPELKTTARKFRQRVGEIADQLDLDQSFLTRELNVGFSGGEKKKIEMLQLLLLRPKLAILDETDSGLDVDALTVVSKGIEAYRTSCGGALLMITHNTRILERLSVDRTHVMEPPSVRSPPSRSPTSRTAASPTARPSSSSYARSLRTPSSTRPSKALTRRPSDVPRRFSAPTWHMMV